MTRRITSLTALFFLLGFNTVFAQETTNNQDSAQTVIVYPDPAKNPNPPQKDTVWMQGSREFLKSMNVLYTKPAGFREDQYSECFDDKPQLRAPFGCISNRLISKDGQVIIYAPVLKILTKEDSISINSLFKGSIKSMNHFHIGNLKSQVRYNYSEQTDKVWKDLVDYYSPEDTKIIFNADTAISYSFVLDKADTYKNKFRNVYSLFLQKQDKGFLNIIVFYTDKGKRTLKKYKKGIEGMFHYQN